MSFLGYRSHLHINSNNLADTERPKDLGRSSDNTGNQNQGFSHDGEFAVPHVDYGDVPC